MLGTTVERLREQGWQGPTWWRFGRPGWHPLTDALNDEPDWDLIDRRRQAREDQKQAEEQRAAKAEQDAADAKQQARLLTARAPVCSRRPGGLCR
ncbi:hypothetical protein [Kitasatospora sp. NPDC094011]|uniref:hypothetical protein n=1 Tax=Kitasatospora sp. NPDC094011 TaxID=3364090 RepID=UPI003801C837